MIEEYKKHTKTVKSGSGYAAKCKKGLWRVDAPTKEEADREGMHYFAQYWADGEYDEIRKFVK